MHDDVMRKKNINHDKVCIVIGVKCQDRLAFDEVLWL